MLFVSLPPLRRAALPPSQLICDAHRFYWGDFFIFPEIENFELHVSIFIDVSTMKDKVKRDSNWAEILLIKQSLKNNHLH